ncbi:MAG: hypothetical protein M3O62_13195 [Pseudomonadota bacterium]|nr:hypothetical protein [Pseudomonadota bacterium]
MACFVAPTWAEEPKLRCGDARVTYSDIAAEWRSNVQLIGTANPVSKSVQAQLEPPVFTEEKSRHSRMLKPDTMRTGPWTTTIYVYEGTGTEPILAIKVAEHANAGPYVTWINEKLLHIVAFWGRIAGSELILDVEKMKWIYAEDAHYGQMVEPCRE